MKILYKYQKPLSFIRELLKDYKLWMVVILIETIIGSVFSLVIPYIAKLETDQLIQKNTSFLIFDATPITIFMYIVGCLFLIQFIDRLIKTLFSWLQEKYREQFADQFFLKMYRRLQYIELGVYSNKRNQDLFDRILGEKYFVGSLLSNIMTYVNMIIFVIGSIGILSQVDKKIGIALLIGGIAYYIFYYIETKIDVYGRFQVWSLERSLREIEWITRTDFHRLAYAGGTQLVEDTIKDYNANRRSIVYTNNRKRETIEIIKNIITEIIENSIKIIVGISVFSGLSSVGSLVLTIALLQKLSGFIRSIITSKKQIEDARESLDILTLYLDATTEYGNKTIHTQDYDKIILQNLTFAYPPYTTYELQFFDILLKRLNKSTNNTNDRTLNKIYALQEAKAQADLQPQTILHDISLIFEKGNIYGIVGRNGAGKTTLMHLLMNYFHLPEKSIQRGCIGNESLAFSFFEDNIAVIEQVPFILRGFTIRQNLLLGVSKNYSDEELYEFLAMFDLDDKIRTMRKGLDTLYSYDCDLSGGQQQIIALLRVYLQDKPVMILDEGTNQLDATNEGKIMNLLLKNKKHKIIIMISHRMTSLQKADTLFCLEDGKIIDTGTPSELKKRDSLYRKFWNEQVESL